MKSDNKHMNNKQTHGQRTNERKTIYVRQTQMHEKKDIGKMDERKKKQMNETKQMYEKKQMNEKQ